MKDESNADGKSWRDYQVHVLYELRRLDEATHDIEKGIQDIKLELATLKARSITWGGISGFAVTLIAAFINHFLK